MRVRERVEMRGDWTDRDPAPVATSADLLEGGLVQTSVDLTAWAPEGTESSGLGRAVSPSMGTLWHRTTLHGRRSLRGARRNCAAARNKISQWWRCCIAVGCANILRCRTFLSWRISTIGASLQPAAAEKGWRPMARGHRQLSADR